MDSLNAQDLESADPLACANPVCGHPIEAHHPAEYGRDVCVAQGWHDRGAPFRAARAVCTCEGFTVRVQR